jgi:hypothetical protein
MGTWGEGVFDNDAAADLKSDMEELSDDAAEAELLDFIQSSFDDDISVEDTEELLAAVALLHALYERTEDRPPATLDRPALRTMMLEIYDREIDGLEPAEGFKEARRKVMQDTLDRFVAL